MKKALIIGSEGQDGRLLTDWLVGKGVQCVGVSRRGVTSQEAGWKNQPIDIGNFSQVNGLLNDLKPSEIYYLPVVHHSMEQSLPEVSDLFKKSFSVHTEYLIHFLEAIRVQRATTKLFYAASSHLFGNPEQEIQDECTAFEPNDIYGITKLCGLLTCRYYRVEHGVFAACGILYNHESHFRSPQFLSKRIIRGAMDVKLGRARELVVGRLSAEADWGYAPDYVDAMHAILSLPDADDFIVATGKKHSVFEFAKTAFEILGIDWRGKIREDEKLLRKKTPTLIGNAAKLHARTGWSPKVEFTEMIRRLLIAEGASVNERIE